MKNLRVCIAVALLSAAACAQANTFDYSYTFTDGNVVSGTLVGDQSGDFINNVTDVTVFFNGSPISGTVYTAHYQTSSPNYLPGPIVSFDVHKNNFLFANSDFAAGNGNATEFLQIINGNVYGSDLANALFPGSDTVVTDRTFGQWSLTEEVNVPEAGSTLGMLGAALTGLRLLKRRL